ncbi:MAG: hypothetical protein V3R37_03170, partial [Rhodospirillales bacterium]
MQRRKIENALNYYEPYGVMMLRFSTPEMVATAVYKRRRCLIFQFTLMLLSVGSTEVASESSIRGL